MPGDRPGRSDKMYEVKATLLKHETKAEFDPYGYIFRLGYRPRAKHRYVVVCYELDFEMRFDTETEAEAYFYSNL